MGSCYRANLSLTVTTTEAWRALPVDRRVNKERAAAIAGMLFCQDQLGGIWEIILTMTLPQPLSTVLKRSLRPGPLPIAAGGPGTFAQFTPRRSLVRSQYRPPRSQASCDLATGLSRSWCSNKVQQPGLAVKGTPSARRAVRPWLAHAVGAD